MPRKSHQKTLWGLTEKSTRPRRSAILVELDLIPIFMNDNKKKKWTSFEEMRNDLIKEGILDLKDLKTEHKKDFDFLSHSLFGIVADVESANTSEAFFESTCRLSALLEKLDNSSAQFLFSKTNLYVLLLNAVFRNTKFQEEVIRISLEKNIKDREKADALNLESKRLINAAISLAFFSIAFNIEHLTRANIMFLRSQLTSMIKHIIKFSNEELLLSKICFKLEQVIWNSKFQHKGVFPVSLDSSILFSNLKTGRAVAGISFLSLTIISELGSQFKTSVAQLDEEDSSLTKIFNSIYSLIHKIEEGVNGYYGSVPIERLTKVEDFFDFFIFNNERNLLFFIRLICGGFKYQKDKVFYQILLAKIEASRELKEEITRFAHEHLTAFKEELGEVRYEWSNKIYLISQKTLSVLTDIHDSKDDRWKVSVGIFELTEWIKDVHAVLNKYFLEDEWNLIAEYMEKETSEIEWKSSFFTPLEQKVTTVEVESLISKKLFEKIGKTILGMLNTNGGVVIVGLVEKPESVVRDDLSKNFISRNGKVFFDVINELKTKSKTLDSVRLQIFDYLCNTTDNTPEKFNNLVHLDPILLRSTDALVNVVKISVKKNEKMFFNVKKESNNTVWISLTKRAEGQTIDVDIRSYLPTSSKDTSEQVI